MTNKKDFNIVIEGIQITARDLQSVMPGVQSLIVEKILHYSKMRKFIVCDENGNVYVRKSLPEWTSELEFLYLDGRRKTLTKSYICKAFRALVDNGVLEKLGSSLNRINSYRICMDVLKKRLKHLYGDINCYGN